MITSAAILLVLWLIGVITGFTFGGFIHILFFASVIVFLFHLAKGKGQENSVE